MQLGFESFQERPNEHTRRTEKLWYVEWELSIILWQQNAESESVTGTVSCWICVVASGLHVKRPCALLLASPVRSVKWWQLMWDGCDWCRTVERGVLSYMPVELACN
jgi:hypothetical protein